MLLREGVVGIWNCLHMAHSATECNCSYTIIYNYTSMHLAKLHLLERPEGPCYIFFRPPFFF